VYCTLSMMASHIQKLSQFLQSFGVAALALLFVPALIAALARNVALALAASLLSFTSLMLFIAPASANSVLRETVAKDECGDYYEDDTAHPELPKQHAPFSVKALTGSRSMSLIRKTISKILFSETSPLNLKRAAVRNSPTGSRG
jgi:hypothetical protein